MSFLLLGLVKMLTFLSGIEEVGAPIEGASGLMIPASVGLEFMQVTTEPASRAQVPDQSLLASAEQRIAEEFKEEYALKTPLEKVGFANLLLSKASEKTDSVSIRYVLLREAMTIASGAGDLATALQAIDRMAGAFEIDVWPLRERVLSEAERIATKPEDSWPLAQGYLTMADEALNAAEGHRAYMAARMARLFAERAKSLYLISKANAKVQEASELRRVYDHTREALATLTRNPRDPEANLEAGQYECFVRNRWDAGLPMLAKGSNPTIKELAAKDLARPTEAAEQILLGDAWWEAAASHEGVAKGYLRRRADFWYQKVGPKTPGPFRIRIDQRRQELEGAVAAASSIDLLQLVNSERDTVRGKWTLEEGTLLCLQETVGARLQVPYLPPEEYDVAIVAERTSGCEAINVGLSQGDCRFHMVIDAYARTGYASGLAVIDGAFANANATTKRGPLLIQGRPSLIECSVRKSGLSMKLDGKLIFEWSGDFGKLSTYDVLKTPHPRALFISGWDSRYRFSQFTLIPVSGRGEVLR